VGLLSWRCGGHHGIRLLRLERRRQIGILKAVGLKGARVMRVMLLENTRRPGRHHRPGSGALASLMTSFGLKSPFRRTMPAGRHRPVAAAVFIGWLATVLSARVVVRERVLNVLRYE
jgi:hypothetical protein